MPSTYEFTLVVNQQTLLFITFVVKVFLGLVMGLAFMFSFVIAVMYCSAKLLIVGYTVMRAIVGKVQAERRKECEVLL